MSFSLIRSIASQVWAIDANYVESIMPFLVSLLNGEAATLEEKQQPFLMMAAAGEPQAATRAADAQPGSIAIVRMSGPMMKNDQFCGPVGTATIGATLQELAANPNVDGIILKIDSPGGTIDGTEDLARIVGSIKKPITAFVDGLSASAAMWVASAANEIVLSGQTARVGSIGTMASFADMRPALEKAGVKFHNIKASRSVDKNTDYDKALTGEYDGYIKNSLDPINAVFTAAIEKNRAGKIDLSKEDVLTGKIYMGKAAIKAGLADSIGSMDDAIKSIRNRISSKKPTSGMKLSEQYPRLAATAQFDAAAETLASGSVEITAEEMARVEASLAEAETAAANLLSLNNATENLQAAQAELATAQEQLATATADLTAANARIAELQAEIAELGKGTGAAADTSKAEDEGVEKPTKRKKYAHELLAEQHGL